MADGKLVFPVKFDLEAAVKEASGDADRVLKRLNYAKVGSAKYNP